MVELTITQIIILFGVINIIISLIIKFIECLWIKNINAPTNIIRDEI